ncbi:hypothetical protein Tco_0008004 [Tanacetum coccineum]
MTSQEIFLRKTKSVKFTSTLIIPSELKSKNEIFNNIGYDEYIMKMKGSMQSGKDVMPSIGDGNRITIPNEVRLRETGTRRRLLELDRVYHWLDLRAARSGLRKEPVVGLVELCIAVGMVTQHVAARPME